MKQKILTIIISIFAIHSQIFAYQIDIRIEGLKSCEILLTRHFGEQQLIVDTAQINDIGLGSFTQLGHLQKGIYMVVLPKSKYFEILVSSDDDFSISTDTVDLFFNLNIIEAEESSNFLQHQKNVIKKQKLMMMLKDGLRRMDSNDRNKDDFENKLKQVGQEIKNLNEQFLTAYHGTFAAQIVKSTIPIEVPDFQNTEGTLSNDSLIWMKSLMYYKQHYFDNFNLKEDGMANTPIIYGKANSFFNKVVYQDPDSINKAIKHIFDVLQPSDAIKKYLLSFILSNYNKNDKLGFEDVILFTMENYVDNIDLLVVDYKTRNDILFKLNYLKKTAIGEKAPNLKGVNSQGGFTSLHNIEAQYTLLLFWNPECPHCEEEMSKIISFYNTYKQFGIEIYGFCTHSNFRIWQDYVHSKNLTWTNVYDPENSTSFREIYQVYYTPKIYLLDQDKYIVIKSNNSSDILDYIKNHPKR